MLWFCGIPPPLLLLLRSQLRKSLVTHFSIRPSPGEALLLQHTLTNSIGRDAVFELRVSHPRELAAVESLQELRDLQQSCGTGISTVAAGPASQGQSTAAAAAGASIKGGDAAAQPPKLQQLARQAASGGGGAAAGAGRVLVSRGRILLAAGESVSIPLRFTLQADDSSCDSNPGGQQQQQQHVVTVDFVPLGLDWPVSILELAVHPQPAVVDRTLRYHCPEQELLHVEVALTELQGASRALLAAAASGKLTVVASRQDVGVTLLTREQPAAVAAGAVGTRQPPSPPQQQRCYVCLRYRCNAAQEAVQFYVWLYGDAAMAQPLEAWQVRPEHALAGQCRRVAAWHKYSLPKAAGMGGAVDMCDLYAQCSMCHGNTVTLTGALVLLKASIARCMQLLQHNLTHAAQPSNYLTSQIHPLVIV